MHVVKERRIGNDQIHTAVREPRCGGVARARGRLLAAASARPGVKLARKRRGADAAARAARAVHLRRTFSVIDRAKESAAKEV